MKKHWFLIAILGTLIGFTACKKEKENMIIGKWELISIEGGSFAESYSSGDLVYFFTGQCYFVLDKNNNIIHCDSYFIQGNKIHLTYPKNRKTAVSISFSGSKKMTWKGEESKFTFEKI